MGYVASALGFTALGAYLGRDLSNATGLVLLISVFAVIFGLNIAAAGGREQLAIGLLFALGLLLGLAVAPIIADYARADPAASGRQPVQPRLSSPPPAHMATPRAQTSVPGREHCRGRCSP